ncbi:pyridoxal phosphate-dependent decarboxylase family protein [Phytoactinopolyspora limicola]|uniref:pyridoxal phosphate-dependent decarboxylase family protein n=1 Tax=Phytoactinopolyspora limicola TaxID=2715536 RepID=UPI0014082FFF|nr:pyridoxal-dependent decarboxylase [Phytoactinopolyspora limicola]
MTVHFLHGRPGAEALRSAVDVVLDALTTDPPSTPFPAMTPDQFRPDIEAIDPLPADGVPFETVIGEVREALLTRGADVTHPWCAAHLHAPTLLAAVAAELAIAATNQSMDSFDQAPAATYAEDHLVQHLARVLGLPPGASGVLTAGGTSSNLLGLTLARDHAAGGANVTGLPAEAGRWRVFASAAAHVSIRQACAVLGLGRTAVVPVATDDAGRMRVDALDDALAGADHRGEIPVAIVGTAGTTDAGAIDPLEHLAERAARYGAWFHVDAAVGAALALSDRLRPLLAGLERADSVTADLHKLWWQPIGASALLVRQAASWRDLREPAAYLNRVDDTEVLNLADRSLDTSRRFDAFKILVSLRATGRRQLARYVEHIVDLTAAVGELVAQRPDLELMAAPQTVTVLFRCRPVETPETSLDALNVAVQRELLTSGRAVVGRTQLDGRAVLKLTLINPLATGNDIAALLDTVVTTAASLTRHRTPQP